ncbi:MAG: topoisomerase DNA-binding C4 zinc finger domain-containing protein, partial [Clostridia bacterium]|nr:topoisomerase DNA-binding C4 zinc finger domain-containing protein [Clostridia bacterium]
TQADIDVNGYIFKASGYVVDFDGYTVLYVESTDNNDEEKESELPELKKDMQLKVKEMTPNQHFTQPPARYTEASLIKAMEEYGIGRPSTYAATISTITSREYVKRQNKTLYPTELGEVTTKLMEERFPKIVNVKFTAQMEQNLDTVEDGECGWVDLLTTFYDDFDKTLKQAKEDMKDVKIELEEDKTDLICDKCGKPMVVKFGKYGKFIACSGFPDCRNIVKLINTLKDIDCPKCGGSIVVRKTKKGRLFYGCSNYPNCNFVSWYEPTNEKCPQCGEILFRKKGKKPALFCNAEGCGYSAEDTLEETEIIQTIVSQTVETEENE